MNFLMRGASVLSVVSPSVVTTMESMSSGAGRCDGEEGRQFAGDVEDSAAFDGYGFELAGGEERMDYVADARAGGEGREESFDLFLRRDDGLAEVERDEGRERGGLSGVGSGFNLFGEAGGGEFPEGWGAVGLRDGENPEVLPEFGEGAEDGGLGDFFAELRGEVVGGEADRLAD